MINTVVISGRLTADPELRTTQSGKSVTNFTLAVDSRKGADPEWIDCVAWSAAAEILRKYCAKGDKIGVTGHIQTRHYQDKEGKNHKVTEVIAEMIDLPERSRIVADPEAVEPVADDDDDGLPF